MLETPSIEEAAEDSLLVGAGGFPLLFLVDTLSTGVNESEWTLSSLEVPALGIVLVGSTLSLDTGDVALILQLASLLAVARVVLASLLDSVLGDKLLPKCSVSSVLVLSVILRHDSSPGVCDHHWGCTTT